VTKPHSSPSNGEDKAAVVKERQWVRPCVKSSRSEGVPEVVDFTDRMMLAEAARRLIVLERR
jgi:hypothetical protein